MASLKEGILIKNLPKTFRDACQVAKSLGVQYIWIDSLCIVQDDRNDWAREASKMSEVYANAYLTVAASSSLDDDSGCFPARSIRLDRRNTSIEYQTLRCFYPQTPAMIDYRKGGKPNILLSDDKFVQITKEDYEIAITREWLPPSTKARPLPFVIGTFGELFDPLADEPLSKRGWCLQERLLSRRTLHYATSQMFWECSKGIQSEDGCFFPSLKPDGTASIEGIGKLKPNAFRTLRPYAFKRVETSLLLYGLKGIPWTELVAEYSQRNLTVEQDKLSAIAGIARHFAAITGATYIAGLWGTVEALASHLCWQVHTHEEIIETSCEKHSSGPVIRKELSTLSIPSTYRAPSWSWASIDAGVTFQQTGESNPFFSMIHCELEHYGDPYGQVLDGWLRLHGPLVGILCPTEVSVREPAYGEALVVYYPKYYYQIPGITESTTIPVDSCRPGFARHMETLLMGNYIPQSGVHYGRQIDDRPVPGDPRGEDGGTHTTEGIQAIASYMEQLDLSVQHGPSGAEVSFFDPEAAESKIVVTGEGYFDIKPKFPCVGLFLDDTRCLLLERTNNKYQDYRRIGLGSFERAYQKMQPVNSGSPKRAVNII